MSPNAASSMTGKETISYCTSCKMDLAHTIVAMQGDRIVRVHCKTCKKEHAYKAAKGITDPSKSPAKKTKKTAAEKAEERSPIEVEWQKLMNQHKNAPVKNYTVKGSFDLGTRLTHPTFGEGIVGRLIHPNKIEVIFQNDLKVLIHAGAPSHAH